MTTVTLGLLEEAAELKEGPPSLRVELLEEPIATYWQVEVTVVKNEKHTHTQREEGEAMIFTDFC